MDDDLDSLGVPPSDRKKLESMGLTSLEQIALLTHKKLGMRRGKANTIIRRARNILAHRHVRAIEVDDDVIRVGVSSLSRPVVTAVLDVVGVYEASPGAASMDKEDGALVLRRESAAFDGIVEHAKVQREVLAGGEVAGRGRQRPLGEDEVRLFARERGFDGFWRQVFKEIRGNEVMKQALSVSLFSTFREPVHTIVIGEPGSSKTLAKEIIERNFRDVTTVGANTTRAGLVINLATGEMGALAYSDGKVVLADELDKIPDEDIEHCYELLSNGRCSVHSAKVHEEIESHFVMISFANPSSQVFRDAPIRDIPLPPLLMSRFALIARTEAIDRDTRFDLFKQKFYGSGELQEKSALYNRWVEFARMHQPDIVASGEAVEAYLSGVNDLVEEHYHTNLRRDLRMGDYIRRVPQAIARASFGDVSDETLAAAEHLFRTSMESWR